MRKVVFTVFTLLVNLPTTKGDAAEVIDVSVPGVWKTRPTEGTADWEAVKTPGRVTIRPNHKVSFEIANGVTDRELAGLKELSDVSIVSLTVASSELTDAGVAEIAKLKNIESLYLSACGKITDTGLSHLAKLPNISFLWFTANPLISDEGMKSIGQMKNLRSLSLFGCTKISNAGALQLSQLKRLEFAFFGMTGVNEAGIQELRELMPKCKLQR
jgi:hypothetical protein